jgi:hypothetical protein
LIFMGFHPMLRVWMMEIEVLEFLPSDVRKELEAARRRPAGRRSRLRIELAGLGYRVVRIWDGGFALDAALAPRLRGYVDLYDGSRHLGQCLIVAAVVEHGELICEIKQSTRAGDGPALDFWRDENLPAALLPRT